MNNLNLYQIYKLEKDKEFYLEKRTIFKYGIFLPINDMLINKKINFTFSKPMNSMTNAEMALELQKICAQNNISKEEIKETILKNKGFI